VSMDAGAGPAAGRGGGGGGDGPRRLGGSAASARGERERVAVPTYLARAHGLAPTTLTLLLPRSLAAMWGRGRWDEVRTHMSARGDVRGEG
jgi:hypothetical protein